MDFKCSFPVLDAKQELMVFPVLLLDWEAFTAGQESGMFPALVLSSHHWKGTWSLLPEPGKPCAF